MTRRIKLLSSSVYTKIAAGEIIFRPSSVVKELIENSIDANANDIIIEINHGGKNKIIIKDNGEGIRKEDLILAITPYATSKLYDLNELTFVNTMGFRGEALSSISSVSKLKIISKNSNQNQAWMISNQSSRNILPAAHHTGTSVIVSDIFYNLPIRRKFLKSDKIESQHIIALLKKFALCYFNISFTFKNNGKVIKQFSQANNISLKNDRIAKICGNDFLKSSILIEDMSETLSFNLYICVKHLYINKISFIYVNKRLIQDKLISQAVKLAYFNIYKNLINPFFILSINISTKNIDINIHPSKKEIKFLDSIFIKEYLSKVIQNKLKINFENNLKQDGLYYRNKHFIKIDKKNDKIIENLGKCLTLLDNNLIISNNTINIYITDLHLANRKIFYNKIEKLYQQKMFLPRKEIKPIMFLNIDLKILNILEIFFKSLVFIGFNYNKISDNTIILKTVPINLSLDDISLKFKTISEKLIETSEQNVFESIYILHQFIDKSYKKKYTIKALNYILKEIGKTNNYIILNNVKKLIWITLNSKDFKKFF